MKMSPEELEMAWKIWYERHYPFQLIDREVESFLPLVQRGPWLKKVREASFLSLREVARRLGVRASNYHRWERLEGQGRLTLARLRLCAEAMECEVVYSIRPKDKTLFSRKIWGKVLVHVLKRANAAGKNWISPTVLSTLVKNKMYDPVFRKSQGWTKNFGSAAYGSAKMSQLARDCARTPNSI